MSHAGCCDSNDHKPVEAPVGEVEANSNQQETPTRYPQTDDTTPGLRPLCDLNQRQGEKERGENQSADDQEPKYVTCFHLGAGYSWTPRNSKKIPSVQNPAAAIPYWTAAYTRDGHSVMGGILIQATDARSSWSR